jgi:hypothetical protein
MTEERPEDILVEFFAAAFDCHTLVLYGSRAQGKAHANSDWDLVGVTRWNRRSWYNETVEGVGEVNAYIYPEAAVNSVHLAEVLNLRNFLGIRHGVVLCEEHGLGQRIVAAANEIYNSPPEPLVPGFVETIAHYSQDIVLGTMQKPHIPELVKQYRFHEGLVKSLFNYFILRGILRPPAKDGIVYLRDHDPEGFALFCRAAQRGATPADLEAWLTYVMP